MSHHHQQHGGGVVVIKKASGLADLVCGSIAGVTGKLVEYPFDTIKVRLQTQPLVANTSASASAASFSGPLDCFLRSVRSEGFLGLYKGLSAPLVGSMIENSGLFLAYNQVQALVRALSSPERITFDDHARSNGHNHNQHKEQAPLSVAQLALCGVLSGAIVSTVLTPVELVKCKLQVQGVVGASSTTTSSSSSAPRYRGAWHIVTHTLRTQGLGGFYRGHLGTLLREAGGGGAWFGVYELVCKAFVDRLENDNSARGTAATRKAKRATKEDLPMWQLMAAGALAGMAFNASLYPGGRDQVADADSGPIGFVLIGVFVVVVVFDDKLDLRRDAKGVPAGVRGLYRGCGITVARSAPTSAVIFATYETLARYITF
ncbi:mitochondrial carrier domain-containing protein [Zopfochytrium polystomum]|nr:mitochondrial carrier domain-containing protein [Zopfochytrium polystomum]